jgi:hypothetical protein
MNSIIYIVKASDPDSSSNLKAFLNKEDAESYLKELKELEGTCPYLNIDYETESEEEFDLRFENRLTWETQNLPEGFRVGNQLSIEEIEFIKGNSK